MQKIPVAVLTTDTFDATQVDASTVAFGPNGASESHGRSHFGVGADTCFGGFDIIALI